MSGDLSIDPRRCFVHGLTRVQHFSPPMPSDTTSCGVSWWECPLCNHATAVFNINAPAAVAPPSAPPFDPEFNCPTHFAKGDPTCAACIAKQPAFGPPEITAPTATEPPKLTPHTCGHCGESRDTINGAWLKWRRENAGVGLRELARRCGLSAAFLSDVEHTNRHATPRVEAAYREHL